MKSVVTALFRWCLSVKSVVTTLFRRFRSMYVLVKSTDTASEVSQYVGPRDVSRYSII